MAFQVEEAAWKSQHGTEYQSVITDAASTGNVGRCLDLILQGLGRLAVWLAPCRGHSGGQCAGTRRGQGGREGGRRLCQETMVVVQVRSGEELQNQVKSSGDREEGWVGRG